jgi:hypothetical protein
MPTVRDTNTELRATSTVLDTATTPTDAARAGADVNARRQTRQESRTVKTLSVKRAPEDDLGDLIGTDFGLSWLPVAIEYPAS